MPLPPDTVEITILKRYKNFLSLLFSITEYPEASWCWRQTKCIFFSEFVPRCLTLIKNCHAHTWVQSINQSIIGLMASTRDSRTRAQHNAMSITACTSQEWFSKRQIQLVDFVRCSLQHVVCVRHKQAILWLMVVERGREPLRVGAANNVKCVWTSRASHSRLALVMFTTSKSSSSSQ